MIDNLLKDSFFFITGCLIDITVGQFSLESKFSSLWLVVYILTDL